MGKIDPPRVLVLQLLQAAARAAITQAFPFGVGHFLQRLGFPEETLLARWLFGRRGHSGLRFRNGLVIVPSMGRHREAASGAARWVVFRCRPFIPMIKSGGGTIGLWPLLG